MFIKRLISPLTLLCVAVQCYAQDSLATSQDAALQSPLLRSYEFVKQQSPWLTSSNAAGLTFYQAKNIAAAEAGLSYAEGGLIDYWQAPRVLQANVRAEAFQRLSERTVVYGAICYDNYTGRQMTGSAFIDPTRKPFNIVEDSLTNTGRKHRDTYQLTGAVGVDLGKGYSIGGRIDYTSANYAKYKDLRHSNKLMDLRLSVGATAHMLSWLTVGANYLYHRNTESLTFSTYGKEEKVYKSLIDYAAFMGRVEQFGNTGYTEKGREIPLVEDQHGGSIQIEARPADSWAFYADVTFCHGNGYYGRKSPYTITFTNHNRDIITADAMVRYLAEASQHTLKFAFSHEKLKNNTETYRELTNQNGAYYYEYYDAVNVADKSWTNLQVSYTADLQIQGELPTWTLMAGFDWQQRKLTGIQYPYFRKQQLNTARGYVSGARNFLMRKGVLTATARFSYQKGSGAPFEDGLYQTPSKEDYVPPTMEAFLYQEYRYLTAAQYAFGADVKYAFVFPGTQLATYVKGGIDYNRSNTSNDYTDGNYRIGLNLAIGCLF